MSTIFSFSEARARKQHLRNVELVRVLSFGIESTVPVDAGVLPLLQRKADALGWDIDMSLLDDERLVQVVEIMDRWGLLVRQRIGVQSAPAVDSPQETYLQAVASGRPRDAKLPAALTKALRKVVGDKVLVRRQKASASTGSKPTGACAQPVTLHMRRSKA